MRVGGVRGQGGRGGAGGLGSCCRCGMMDGRGRPNDMPSLSRFDAPPPPPT